MSEDSTSGAHEVSPFRLDKTHRSVAPPVPTETDNRTEAPHREPRSIMPVKFTRPGQDIYMDDDPDAAPVFSDMRPTVVPADSDFQVIGDEEEVATPKDLSALVSVESSPPSTTPVSQETTVPVSDAIQIAANSLEGVDKDSGTSTTPTTPESSTPSGSSIPTPKPGSSEPPVVT